MDESDLSANIFNQVFIEQSDLCETIINSMGDGLIAVDYDGKIRLMNHIAEILTGWRREAAMGTDIASVYQVYDLDEGIQAKNIAFLSVFEENERFAVHNRFRLKRKDGYEIPINETASPIVDTQDNLLGAILIFREITESLEAENQSEYQATHDYLTQLPNRMLFMDHLIHAIANARRTMTKVGVLYIDLDKFKTINDTYGHDLGDKVLQNTAIKLKNAVRETDTVARIGGDEFGAVLTNLTHQDHVAAIVEKISASFTEPVIIGELKIPMRLSIGSSIFPDDAGEIEALLDQADQTMYQHKQQHGSSYER